MDAYSLIPVFERLPETMDKAERNLRDSPHDPLLIGLGAAAEIIIDHVQTLDHPRCSGAIAWLHANDSLTVNEFDAFGEHINRHLPKAALCIVALTIHPDWPESQRILSLILVGDEGKTTGDLGLTHDPKLPTHRLHPYLD